jgi:hypothetical protein
VVVLMARIIGILLAVGLVVLVVKWVLITAAVLAVPFGAWWMYDRVSAGRRLRSDRA